MAREMTRDWASQRRQTTGFSDFINLIESLSNIGERDKKATVDSLENIVKLSTISQTPEQIDNAQRALNNLSKASSLYDTTNTAYDLVQTNLNNKRYEIDKFGSSVDQASDIINDPNFRDKAEDWRDLEGLRKSKLNDDGSYKYDSVSEMLSDEYSAVDNILGAINEGIGKGYRYNKNINFDDDDTSDKLTEYKKRLDKAIQASLGDGVISIEEANIIMSNYSKAEFKAYATERKTDLKTQIKEQEGIVQALGSNELFDMIEGATGKSLQDLGIEVPSEAERKVSLEEAQTHLDTLLTQWKNWAGVDYKVKSLDTQELGEFADEDVDTVKVDDWKEMAFPGHKFTPELPPKEIKTKGEEKEEGEEKEVYTKEEKALIDSYDSDMAKLEEIDTWLSNNPPVKDIFWEKDKPKTRKEYNLEKKRIKKKWKSPGGGVIKDEEGNVVADYRTGLERKVFELKKRLK